MQFKSIILKAAMVALFAPTALLTQAGTITGIAVQPDPACVDEQATIQVLGTGSCQGVLLQLDAPNSVPMEAKNVDLPATFTHTYDATGTYSLVAGSDHPQCTGDAQLTLEVKEDCYTVMPSDGLTDMIEIMRPRILGGFGLIQPGNPFPIVVFGKNFGPEAGAIRLEGAFGVVELDILEWGEDGKFASGYVPAGICGVLDHEAEIRVVSKSLWWSAPWPVQFTAQRDVMVLPRSAAQVLACSDDANKDCCNGVCDPDDSDWFITGNINTTLNGSHYNAWGEWSDDSGTDRYRVDLSEGVWRMESTDFSVYGVDPGEGWAQLKSVYVHQERTADFEVKWLVTPNDNVAYDVNVNISGPCGTSFLPGSAQSALTGNLKNLEAMAHVDKRSATSLARFESAKRVVHAAELRRAERQDRETQQALGKMRAAVTDASIEEAKQLQAMRAQALELQAAARRKGADEDRINAQIEEFLQQLKPSEAAMD